jgi:hypothetical protein
MLVVTSWLAAAPADANPHKPKAELVAKNVAVALSGGQVAVSVDVKNKGARKAKASQTTFTLSKDGTVSPDDALLGTVATPAIRPTKSKTVTGRFTVPASLAPGAYQAIACVDSANTVKERKEGNDCKASEAALTISKVTITWSESNNSPNGIVTATATGGSCTAPGATGTCTVFAGASKVTLSAGPPPAPIISFNGWVAGASGPCGGVRSGTTSETLTFTDPTANQDCVATYDFTM